MKTTHIVLRVVNGVRTVDSYWCRENTAKDQAKDQAIGLAHRDPAKAARTWFLVAPICDGTAINDLPVLFTADPMDWVR